MAIKIMDKNGHTYEPRSEKEKVYNLRIQIQQMSPKSIQAQAVFNINGIVDIIASYMGFYLSISGYCLSF